MINIKERSVKLVKKRTESLQIRLTDRTKRRLLSVATDKSMSMNDVVNLAVKNYLDDYDMSYSQPNEVIDRMNAILQSQMNIVSSINRLSDKIDYELSGNNDRDN